MTFTAKERKEQNERNMDSQRIVSLQEQSPMFHFENGFSPEFPTQLRTRSYRKVYEDEHYADIGMVNVPGDYLDNKLAVLRYFQGFTVAINTKKLRHPA
jgi:hypothetical protein